MDYKIVEEGDKFRIKKVDAEGNSAGVLDEVFDSHEAASAHIVSLTPGTSTTPNESSNTMPAPEKKFKVTKAEGIDLDGVTHLFGEEIMLNPENETAKGLISEGFVEEVQAVL